MAILVQENFPAFTSEISPEVNNVIESEKHERNPLEDPITSNKKDWLDLQIRASTLENKLDAYSKRSKPAALEDFREIAKVLRNQKSSIMDGN